MSGGNYKMKFITYDQWIDEYAKTHARAEGVLLTVECPECDGTGEVECECCGNETSCEDCEGSGRIKTDDFDKDEAKRSFEFKRMYQQEIIGDTCAFSAWTGRGLLEIGGDAIKHINAQHGRRYV